MRAICEACSVRQTPAWQAGDLCTHCGKAVRREVRCFWCATWTPAAKFCRTCGAECVESHLYGAARMLKDAGTDRFTVPRLLRELDPDQIENFTRIYQRQMAIITRQIDDLRWLESHLRHRHWSALAEEDLIPQLPMDERGLARFVPVPLPEHDPLAAALALQTSSPLQLTRDLAAMVRLRLGDQKARPYVHGLMQHPDPRMCDEAALRGIL